MKYIAAFVTNKIDRQKQKVISYSAIFVVLVCLYFLSLINYLLFHTLAETFSIVVAFSIFVIAWNSRRYLRNSYLLFIGIAYLFIAILDLLHMVSYKGMPIFTDYDYYANQLWIGARYMESCTLLLGFLFLGEKRYPRAGLVFSVYFVITALIIASIFVWKIFPECFNDEIGLTPFKKVSEYIICLILITALSFLYINKVRFEGRVFTLLSLSIVCTILSELAFTYYVSNYGLSNLVGHYFKIFSFLLIYEAIIKTGIEKPFEVIFHELDKTNKELRQEIEFRKRAEAEKVKLIKNLEQALEEIETLQGMLPICSICKNIRDDKGYWNGIETYFAEHSDLVFSHGLCPDCAKKHYPEFYDPDE